MRPLRSVVASVVVLVAAGCGPSHARPEPAVDRTVAQGGPGDGGAVRASERCASTYAAVSVGAACTDTAATCGFPEGNCWCGPRSYCGGARPPDELLAELAVPAWQCKAFRTDGCPEVEPTGACSSEGQTCTYGDCCFTAVTCQSGAWAVTGGGCPP